MAELTQEHRIWRDRSWIMRLIAAMLCLWLATAPAYAEWRQAKTRHFLFYSQGSESALRAFAIKVERFDATLRLRFAVSDADEPQRLTIYMLPTTDSVQSVYGKGSKTVAGFYVPRAEGSYAVVPRTAGNQTLDADIILFHEYTHHFMLRNFPVAYPAWFTEGFAEYLSTTDFTKDGNPRIGLPANHRAYGLVLETPIPARRLLTASVSEIGVDDKDKFYGRAWLLTHYLNASPERNAKLSQYLDAINAGKSSLDAATTSFGDLAALDKELAKYLAKSTISVSKLLTVIPPPAELDVSLLDPASAQLVPLRLSYRQALDNRDDGKTDEGKKGMAQLIMGVQKIVAANPLSGDALLLLAQAQSASGDDTGAEKAVDAALAINPKLTRALLLKGQIRCRDNLSKPSVSVETWKTTRGWFIKANRADTNDPMPLVAYYRSWHDEGVEPSATSFRGMERAFEMVPESVEVRFALINAYSNNKKWDEAIRLAKVIAFDPHGGGAAGYAQKILAELQLVKAGSKPAVGLLKAK